MSASRTKAPRAIDEQLHLRDAMPSDAAVVAEIFNESIAAGGSCMVEELQSVEDIRRQIEGFGPREVIVVLEDEAPGAGERTILGWGIIKRYSERRGYSWACETAVYLRRDRVGCGHGTRIKKALFHRCIRMGYHHMVAKIFAENKASIEYNLRLGYEMVGIQKEIGFQNGRWQDVVILQKILPTPLPSAEGDAVENTAESSVETPVSASDFPGVLPEKGSRRMSS